MMTSLPTSIPAEARQVFAAREAEMASSRTRQRSLRRLQRVLLAESALGLLLCTGLVFPAGLVAALLGTLALLSVPMLLKSLLDVQAHGWIQAFFASVGGAALLLLAPADAFGEAVYLAPLVAFYGYCAVLRWRVGQWLAEMRWRVDYLRT